MQEDISRLVCQYSICQQAKIDHTLPNGLPIPQQVWDDIALDFITHLPMSQGFSNILVVVDRLSKYGHFIP